VESGGILRNYRIPVESTRIIRVFPAESGDSCGIQWNPAESSHQSCGIHRIPAESPDSAGMMWGIEKYWAEGHLLTIISVKFHIPELLPCRCRLALFQKLQVVVPDH